MTFNNYTITNMSLVRIEPTEVCSVRVPIKRAVLAPRPSRFMLRRAVLM